MYLWACYAAGFGSGQGHGGGQNTSNAAAAVAAAAAAQKLASELALLGRTGGSLSGAKLHSTKPESDYRS